MPYLIFTTESRFLFLFYFSHCDVYKKKDEKKKKEKKLIITNTRCDIVRWHTRTGVCASKKREKPNGVYFEIRKKTKMKRKRNRKLNRALCYSIHKKRESNFIDFVDDNRLFFSRFFFLFKSRIDIQH
jgi:hypothetical protein